MQDNQMLFADASSFKSKDGREFNVLQAIQHDGYGKLKAATMFCDGIVFGMYTGPGIYDVVSVPYIDREGNQKARLSSIKKVKALEI